MEYKITGFHPESLFHYFEEISAIPRGSKNEKQVSDYLVQFAQAHGLDYVQDDLFNVIIKKPGSAGQETKPSVMLQGHLDMVCEKNKDTAHNFETDGIDLIVDGEFVHANETTLGADNGIAVAMMLSILSDSTLCHPPLECVFTVQEEIGLNGAAALDASLLTAKTMINLDSEEEGIATVSCAGGLRAELSKPVIRESSEYSFLLEIDLSGLTGGHSGTDIKLERANANLLMGRILYRLLEHTEFKLIHLSGGNKDNAIPREAHCVLAFSDLSEQKNAEQIIAEQTAKIADEIAATEPKFTVRTNAFTKSGELVLSDCDTRNLIYLLYLAPNGPQKRNIEQGGFIVTSLNLGVITMENDQIRVVFSPRSSVASLQEETKSKLALLAQVFGFHYQESGEYPGWKYAQHSKIRDIFCETFERLFHRPLQIEAIHAGLECGLFSDKIPGLDAIAVGPTMTGCHTPEETLDIKSCERTWILLTEVLKALCAD